MREKLIKKVVAYGIILVFVGVCILPAVNSKQINNSEIQKNKSPSSGGEMLEWRGSNARIEITTHVITWSFPIQIPIPIIKIYPFIFIYCSNFEGAHNLGHIKITESNGNVIEDDIYDGTIGARLSLFIGDNSINHWRDSDGGTISGKILSGYIWGQWPDP